MATPHPHHPEEQTRVTRLPPEPDTVHQEATINHRAALHRTGRVMVAVCHNPEACRSQVEATGPLRMDTGHLLPKDHRPLMPLVLIHPSELHRTEARRAGSRLVNTCHQPLAPILRLPKVATMDKGPVMAVIGVAVMAADGTVATPAIRVAATAGIEVAVTTEAPAVVDPTPVSAPPDGLPATTIYRADREEPTDTTKER